MTSDNSKSQIDFLDLKKIKFKFSFTIFEIQFKIRDLRLYYSTVQLLNKKYLNTFWELCMYPKKFTSLLELEKMHYH